VTLRLTDVSVVRSGTTILDSANITVRAGTFTAICGANGAGKSTALSVLSGSETPSQGKVSLDARGLGSFSMLDLARRRAVVAQHHRLTFPFLVHEVVAMGRAPHHGRTSKAHDADVCAAVMDLMDVTHLAERNYLTLSGGERQRVMIARVLSQLWDAPDDEVRYLLLDEPTAALDLKYQIKLLRLLRRLADCGWAIAAVLHDLGLVKASCHEVVLMQHGRVAHVGSPLDTLTPERIASVFDLDEPYVIV